MGRLARFIHFFTNEDKGAEPSIPEVWETVSGAIASFVTQIAYPIRSLVTKIEPIQDLHGYDSPWPAGGGMNKFNPAEAQNNKWINNNTGEIESVSGFWVTGFIPVKSGDVIRSALKGSARNAWYSADKSQATYFAFNGEDSATAPSDGFAVLAVSSSTVAYGSDFIVTINNADLTYSPYSNICPISGRTSAAVTRCGKNLCPINTLDDVEWATENNDLLTFINGLANGTYNMAFKSTIKTLTDDTGYWVTGFVFTSPSGFVNIQASTNATHSVGSVQTKNVSFAINDNNRGKFTHAYIYGAGNNQVGKTGTATITEIQVELGSASAYESYQGNTYTITLGDTVYGGQLDVTGGKMVVDRAMDVFDGSLDENWAYFAADQGNMFRLPNYSSMKPTISVIPAISNAFKPVSQGKRANGTISSGVNGTNVDFIFSGANSLAEWREWLAENNVQFCYELATPFEITLTPTQIETLIGQNNVWSANSENVEVEYLESGFPEQYTQVAGFAFDADCYFTIKGFKLKGSDTVRFSLIPNAACNVFGCYTTSSADDNYSLYISTANNSKYLRYNGKTYKSKFTSDTYGKQFDIVITPTGSRGMPEGQDDTWDEVDFTTSVDMCIGTTSIGASSSKLKGQIIGVFTVDGRFSGVPCKRNSDNVLGYYDMVSKRFYTPTIGTPTVVT